MNGRAILISSLRDAKHVQDMKKHKNKGVVKCLDRNSGAKKPVIVLQTL